MLNWALPEEQYAALCRLPQEAPKRNLEDMEPEAGAVKVLETLAPPPKE